MKFILPILKEKHTFDKKNKIITVQTRTEEDFNFDFVIAAQEKFERCFPKQAEQESFNAYAMRLFENAENNTNKVGGAAVLKFLFCCFESDKVSTLNEFTDLFQTSDKEYNEDILIKIQKIFEIMIGNLKNSKN